MQTTWQSHEKHSELTERSDRPDSVYAFAKQAVHGTVDDVIETVKENVRLA